MQGLKCNDIKDLKLICKHLKLEGPNKCKKLKGSIYTEPRRHTL